MTDDTDHDWYARYRRIVERKRLLNRESDWLRQACLPPEMRTIASIKRRVRRLEKTP